MLRRSASHDNSQNQEPPVPRIHLQDSSPRPTSDSQESLLDDEARINAIIAGSNSPKLAKNVTFSENIQAVIPPLIRSSSGLRLRGYKSILKKEDKQRESVRRVLEYAGERLHKDLCLLVEERDRVLAALELTPIDVDGASPSSITAHTHYRDTLLQNKGVLDAKIDIAWRKLLDAPIDFTKYAWVFNVSDSSQLTMKAKRKIVPRRSAPFFTIEKKTKNEIELASEYAQKLAKIRAELVRKDSDDQRNDDGYFSLLQRVSRTLGSTSRLHTALPSHASSSSSS